MTKFHHYDRDGAPVRLDLTDRPVCDRITTRSQRTKYKGEGICLGAQVTGRGRRTQWSGSAEVRGQVWAQAPGGRGYWWVVEGTGAAWIVHDSTMTVVGQAKDDPALFEERTA